jgi:hypothetical protein
MVFQNGVFLLEEAEQTFIINTPEYVTINVSNAVTFLALHLLEGWGCESEINREHRPPYSVRIGSLDWLKQETRGAYWLDFRTRLKRPFRYV